MFIGRWLDVMCKDHTFRGASVYRSKNLQLRVPMTMTITDVEERPFEVPANAELTVFRKYSEHDTREVAAVVKISEQTMLRIYQGGRVAHVDLSGRNPFRIAQKRTPTLA